MKNVILILIINCLCINVFSQNSVSDIIQNVNILYQKDIKISGIVKETLGLADLCAYLIADEGGEILVSSKNGCPDEYVKITVYGVLRKEINKSTYYLEEISREPFSEITKPKDTPIEVPKIIYVDEVKNAIEEFDFELIEDEVTDIEGFDENQGKRIDDKEELYMIVEKMPVFQDGDINTFRSWVQERLVYPDQAIENNISGKIFLQFIVNKEGFVTEATILRSVDPLIDNEALRVVNSSPVWIPGQQRGKQVNVLFTIPVVFTIE